MVMQATTLPNGMKVYFLHKPEVEVLYNQVQQYLRHGIELRPGDTLFDVGANIGLFSLWAYEQCNRNLNIYAFEPIPPIFEVLQRNAEVIAPDTMKAFCCGLAQDRKTVTFDYYPQATALSTAYPDEVEQARATVEHAINRAVDNPAQGEPPDMWVLRLLPPIVRRILIQHKLNELFQGKQIACQMQRLSDVIRDYSVQHIDLLKIDVERSELDVLLGIGSQDWNKIRQIALEVHNQAHRVDQVADLLKHHDFSRITIEQEPIFQGSEIFNVYAVRE